MATGFREGTNVRKTNKKKNALIRSKGFFAVWLVIMTMQACSSKDSEVRTGKDKRDAQKSNDSKKDDDKTVVNDSSNLTDQFNLSLRSAMECVDTMNLEKKKGEDCPSPRMLKNRFHDMLKENKGRIISVQDYVLAAARFVDHYEKIFKQEHPPSEEALGTMVQLFNRIAVSHNTARMEISIETPGGIDDDRALDPNSFIHRLDALAGEAVKLYGAWYGKHGGRAGVPIDLKKVEETGFLASAAVLKAGFVEIKEKVERLKCREAGDRCGFLLEQRDALSAALEKTGAMVQDIAGNLPDMDDKKKKKGAVELRKAYNELVDARSAVTRKQ